MALTERAHKLVREHFAGRELSNKTAVDATCGNGHDTVFLARMGFQTVLGFDIQKRAIEATRRCLQNQQLNNTKLILDGHENLGQYIRSEIECAMFNLGYLPNTDKTVTTSATSSISAIKMSLANLSKTGLVSILCYPGHPQGELETKAIKNYLAELSDIWDIQEVLSEYPSSKAPILYLIESIAS